MGQTGGLEADLLSFYRAATALRHRHEVLRTGRVEILRATGQTLVVRRTLEDQTAIVAFNAGSTAATIETAASGGPEAALSPAWPPTDAADATLDRASTVRIPPRETRVWTTD